VQTYYNLVNLNIPVTSFDDGEEVAVSELRCSPCSAPEAYCTVWNENPAHKCAQPLKNRVSVSLSVKECSPCSAPVAYCTVWNENPAHKCAQNARGVLR
jgi:hypothetical protein